MVYIVNGSAYKDRKSATLDSNAKRPKTRFCGTKPFPSLPVAHASSTFFGAADDFSMVTAGVTSPLQCFHEADGESKVEGLSREAAGDDTKGAGEVDERTPRARVDSRRG